MGKAGNELKVEQPLAQPQARAEQAKQAQGMAATEC